MKPLKIYITKTPVGYTVVAIRIFGASFLIEPFWIKLYFTPFFLKTERFYTKVHGSVFKLYKP